MPVPSPHSPSSAPVPSASRPPAPRSTPALDVARLRARRGRRAPDRVGSRPHVHAVAHEPRARRRARASRTRAGRRRRRATTRPGSSWRERCLEPARGAARAQATACTRTRRSCTSAVAACSRATPPAPALRRQHPFRLLVRDAGGRENLLHAFAVIDASGVYGQPNWAGDGGIPARGELYLAPQMSYHVDDVLGLRRERYAGKRTIVIGGGASAATVVADLATLAEQAPGHHGGVGSRGSRRTPSTRRHRERPAARAPRAARARARPACAAPAPR